MRSVDKHASVCYMWHNDEFCHDTSVLYFFRGFKYLESTEKLNLPNFIAIAFIPEQRQWFQVPFSGFTVNENIVQPFLKTYA